MQTPVYSIVFRVVKASAGIPDVASESFEWA